MNFNKHSNLEGKHAFLGASSYHWINYDDNKLKEVYNNLLAKRRGTELHEFAATAIKLGVKVSKSKKTLNRYINDAIGFNMEPEVVLQHSDSCFGTADAICFRDNKLRIHDLKTGHIPAHMEQLYIYAAMFCSEYKYSPFDIDIELRIYQNDEIVVCEPDPNDILDIMHKMDHFDEVLRYVKETE